MLENRKEDDDIFLPLLVISASELPSVDKFHRCFSGDQLICPIQTCLL